MNPNKSVYAFGLNRKKPGHFHLAFLANKTATIQTWVSTPLKRVSNSHQCIHSLYACQMSLTSCSIPKSRRYLVYVMLSNIGWCPPELLYLLNAFFRHIHESQNLGAGGSKTPYGGRTPARTPAIGRTPGHATPGRQSLRVPQPSSSLTPQQSFGQPNYANNYPPPSARPANGPPNGVHPSRAAMIQNGSGWGQPSGHW